MTAQLELLRLERRLAARREEALDRDLRAVIGVLAKLMSDHNRRDRKND